MIDSSYLIYFIVFGISIIVLLRIFTRKRIPKGLKELPKTSGWPFIGVYFDIEKPRFAFLFKLVEEHGPIFKFTLGCRDIIVLNSYKVMQKTLKEMGNNFAGRWENAIIKYIHHGCGILFKDKEWWAVQRSFILKVLRDFGLGKQRAQEIVNYECASLMKEINEDCGKVISGRYLFPKYMVNVIAKLVMNMRFERSDDNFKTLTQLIEKHAQNRNLAVTMILMYPILENFPMLSKFLLWCTGRDKESEEGNKYIRKIIDDHTKRFNPENDGEDLIDIFLKEKHTLEKNNVKDHTFTDWQLIRIVFELFAAGYETTSTTLSWSMVLLAKHQDIQEKVHNEIITVIGSSRTPTLSDKKSLNYTQAVMDEIFRVSSVVPLSLPHRVFESTSVDGFYIPKNSIVFPNIFAVHHDKDTWERPFEFYPEHFLDSSSKYLSREDLMPFSIGKRQCLGESLARLEFFTFLTNILQRFRIKFPAEMSDEEFDRITVGTDGTIRAPFNTDVIFEMWES